MDYKVGPRLQDFCLALPGSCLAKQVHLVVHLCINLEETAALDAPFKFGHQNIPSLSRRFFVCLNIGMRPYGQC